jgi:hypothetical protein
MPAAARRSPITAVEPGETTIALSLGNGTTVVVARYLAAFARPGDEVEFNSSFSGESRTELRIVRAARVQPKELYQAQIGYVTQPKTDSRQARFLRAEIVAGGLGIRWIHLPASAVRDHFYRGNRSHPWVESPTLYDVLRVQRSASPGELRLAFKLRSLELEAARAARDELRNLERAFNLLMQPDLRACYDALLDEPDAPAVFPYGGFGSLAVGGELARAGQTFFARHIVSFLPETSRWRFRAHLRRLDFLHDHALYRDSRRKLEVLLDPVLLPLAWDATWGQWKHLVGAKIGIDCPVVASGKYVFRSGEWKLVRLWTALPSRTEVELPGDLNAQVERARATYHRFGQYFSQLEIVRQRLEREPVERRELDRICGELGIPGDFDVAQISWKPDYDSFYYEQLRKRARRMFLFRDEYIFELEGATVVEVPEVGHATYIFAPGDIARFVRQYAAVNKDDIRKNRDGAAERLGFVGRVMHGSNPRRWVQELKSRIGEGASRPAEFEGPTTMGDRIAHRPPVAS